MAKWTILSGGLVALLVSLSTAAAIVFAQTPAQLFDQGVKLYYAGDNGGAFNCFMRAAQQGDPKCETQVGWCYEKGVGTCREALPQLSRARCLA